MDLLKAFVMAFEIQSYDPMPLLVVTFADRVTLDDFQRLYATCGRAAKQRAGVAVWRILDFGDAELDFSTVMAVVKQAQAQEPGQFTDSQFVTLLVGTHNMARLLSDLLAKDTNGGATLTVMPGLGEALLYAQDEIAAGAAGAGG